MGSSVRSFSCPRGSSIDEYLEEVQQQCKQSGTSFSSWLCAMLDPGILEKLHAYRQRERMVMALWIVSSGGVHPNLMMYAPDELKVGVNEGKAIKHHLREEIDAARSMIEERLFGDDIIEAASPPPVIVMTDAP